MQLYFIVGNPLYYLCTENVILKSIFVTVWEVGGVKESY